MENSFYPFIDFLAETNNNIPNNEPLPLYREIAWDFKNDHPLIENNEFKIVEMNDAISVWIYHKCICNISSNFSFCMRWCIILS